MPNKLPPKGGSKDGGGQQSNKALAEHKAPKPEVKDPNQVIGFNCKQPGHFKKGCASPKRLVCFACKKEGFTIKTCTDCSGNGVEE